MKSVAVLLAASISSVAAITPQCCWSGWGDATTCGGYPTSGHGGLCNTDWSKSCYTVSDCAVPLTGAPTPVPVPTPSPPTPKPGPTPPPTPHLTPTVDIIGYYGNSGNAVSSIPKFADVHPNYNVIILTFATISSTGEFSLKLQGPYEKDMAGLAADLKAWKAVPDKWGRRRLALVSIGGQNGNWPSGVTASQLEAGLGTFMDTFGLDGLDIDLEGGAVGAASSLITVIKSLTGSGKFVTAAPEAAQGPLTAYQDILPYLSWVHPQFYNNPPNAVTDPWIPTDTKLWPTPWSVANWQQEDAAGQGQAFWAAVLKQLGNVTKLRPDQMGMLYPASTSAAGAQNNWDVSKLVSQGRQAGVTHFGNWAIAYDLEENWKWAIGLGKLNDY